MNINLYSPQVTAELLLVPMFIPGWRPSVRPAGVFHGGIPLSIHSTTTNLYMVIDPVTSLATTLAAGDSVELWVNGNPTSVIEIIRKGQESDRIEMELPWGWLLNGPNTLFYRVTRLSGNFEDSKPVLNVLFNYPAPKIIVTHPASAGQAQPATFTFTLVNGREFDEVTLTVGTMTFKIPFIFPANSFTYTLTTADLQQIGDGNHPVSARALDQLGNSTVSPTSFIDIHDDQSPVVVSFLNGPFTVAAGGQVKNIQLRLTQAGQPAAGIIAITLPPGTRYPDGAGGTRDFSAGANGTVTVSGVIAGDKPETSSIIASSGGTLANSDLAIQAYGPAGIVSVGIQPLGVTISADGKHLYVAKSNSSSVAVIDTLTSRVIENIPVPGQKVSWDIAINNDGTLAYACDLGLTPPSNQPLTIIDLERSVVIASLAAVTNTAGIVLNRSGSLAYVSSYQNRSVTVVDLQSLLVVKSIQVGANPSSVAISANENFIVVGCMDIAGTNKSISIIDTQSLTVLGTIPLIGTSMPYGSAFSPDSRYIYSCVLSSTGNGEIWQINTQTLAVARVIPVSGTPRDIAINRAGTLAYCCLASNNRLATIDLSTGSIIHSMQIGNGSVSVAISHDETKAYVASGADYTVHVVNLEP